MTVPSISVDDDAGSPIDLNALSDLAGQVVSPTREADFRIVS